MRCVSRLSPDTADLSELVHAPADPSYPPLLASTIQNLRFTSPRTPRPSLLITPRTVAEVQASVACCRAHGLTVRARSGGHDFEGISYHALRRPSGPGSRRFVVLDVAALRTLRKGAQPGVTLGELYYAVAEGSGGALGFPAGICPTVCVGGHLSGGGFGPMMRKHGSRSLPDSGEFHGERSPAGAECSAREYFHHMQGPSVRRRNRIHGPLKNFYGSGPSVRRRNLRNYRSEGRIHGPLKNFYGSVSFEGSVLCVFKDSNPHRAVILRV